MKACLLKMLPGKGKLSENFRRFTDLMARVPEEDIDVFVTPECYLDGYVVTEDHVTAENLSEYGVDAEPGGYLSRVGEIARARGSWFVFGCTHNTEEGPKNAAFVFDRSGEITGVYHKIHLGAQDRKFSPGRELPVFRADFGTFGVMICADRRWPETVRSLTLKGATVIFNPTYGMRGEKNDMMMRTRSWESDVAICFCHPLKSLVTGPTGGVEGILVSSGDHYLIQDIDLEEVKKIREDENSHTRIRAPHSYSPELTRTAGSRDT